MTFRTPLILPMLLVATAGVATAQPRLDAAVELANGKACFFKGGRAALYDLSAERVDPGSPRPLCDVWPGLPDPWCRGGIDAAMLGHGGGKVFFFKGGEYLRFNLQTRTVEHPPRPIAAGWRGVWADGVDVAVNAGNGKAFFFKGGQYLRYDLVADRTDDGYPKDIAGRWPGWPDAWSSGIDAAFCRLNGKVFFFKGGEYVRYDIASDQGDPGYPKAVDDSTWGGLASLMTAAPAPAPAPTSSPTPPPTAPTGGTVIDIPGFGPIEVPDPNSVLQCPREYITYRDGSCQPKPAARSCIEQVTERVRQRGLESKRPSELTFDEARDLTIALHHTKRIQLAPGYQPLFNGKCEVRYPPQLATPSVTRYRGLTRLGITDVVDGVKLLYFSSGDKSGRFRFVRGIQTRPALIGELEVRMVPALYKLASFLRQRYGATRLYHTGVTSADGRHIETGATIDFAGACGGRLGACYGDPGVCTEPHAARKPGAPPCQEPAGLFVMDDWGLRPVPSDRADPNDPNQWRSDVRDPSFRLDLNTADAGAREFFQQLYNFFQEQYRTGAITPIGQDTAIMTPDHPKSSPKGKSGREGHRNHIHAELPAPSK